MLAGHAGEMRTANLCQWHDIPYVSAFGLKSLDGQNFPIFQSTVNLDSSSIEPTIKSLSEHLSTVSGLKI